MGERRVLDRSGLFNLLSYKTRAHLPAWGWIAASRLGPPTSIIYHENATQICRQAGLVKATHQLVFPFLDDSRLFHFDQTN